MKIAIALFAGVLFSAACNFGKEIQVERVNAELIRIDTVFRDTGPFKVFTWKTNNRLTF